MTSVSLWDTRGSEDWDRLRPLSYIAADIFLLCFSVVDPRSFAQVPRKWAPELEHSGPPDAEVVLVGTKIDLRDTDKAKNHPSSYVSHELGLVMRGTIGAAAYCECSALTRVGVDNVFQQAMDCASQSGGQ
ncbi:hypothetical protein CVT26_005265 [Gymnopilus dilepis]|uniref:Uncharacterized protein n=1 Tax=Gymnopilus dilepis TaxID=231916 RepID=A0A409YVL8_9AGAR|nr:hypothetical protein CVT26_005265 [Gymnopilus dilepis]